MTEQLDHLYTPLSEAVSLLHKRRTEGAQSSTNKFEKMLMLQPCAFLSRPIASPNFETARFMMLAASSGLVPLVGEFTHDKFVGCSFVKHALARLCFYDGARHNGDSLVLRLQVSDIHKSNGLPLEQVTTDTGRPLIKFHHDLLAACPHFSEIERYDTSDWFRAHGPTARQYYTDFLSLFVGHAILFENFLVTPHEKPFTTEIVLPAFESVCARHGKRPLICRLDPAEAEGDPYWLQYPMELLPVAKSLLECGDTSLL